MMLLSSRAAATRSGHLIGEGFTGTTGAAPDATLWTKTGAGTATIQSNALRIVTPTATNTGTRIDMTGRAAVGDCELSGTVVGSIAGVAQIAFGGINGDATGTGVLAGNFTPNNAYYVALVYAATAASSSIALAKAVAGTETILAQPTKTLTGTTQYGFRIRRKGLSLMARVWATSGSEPSTWDASVTLTGTPAVGKPFLSADNNSGTTARTFTFDDARVRRL